jgi:hypothetical protein
MRKLLDDKNLTDDRKLSAIRSFDGLSDLEACLYDKYDIFGELEYYIHSLHGSGFELEMKALSPKVIEFAIRHEYDNCMKKYDEWRLIYEKGWTNVL